MRFQSLALGALLAVLPALTDAATATVEAGATNVVVVEGDHATATVTLDGASAAASGFASNSGAGEFDDKDDDGVLEAGAGGAYSGSSASSDSYASADAQAEAQANAQAEADASVQDVDGLTAVESDSSASANANSYASSGSYASSSSSSSSESHSESSSSGFTGGNTQGGHADDVDQLAVSALIAGAGAAASGNAAVAASISAAAASATTAYTTMERPKPTALRPAIPPQVNPSHTSNLQLATSAKLFFAEPTPSSNASVQVANVHMPVLAYAAVVLDHSALITGVSCNASHMNMKFTSQAAFTAAQASWTKHPDPFVFMTFHAECTNSSKASNETKTSRDYIRVESVSFQSSSRTAVAKIEFIELVDVVGHNNSVTVEAANFSMSDATDNRGFAANTADLRGAFNGTNGTIGQGWNSTRGHNKTKSTDFDVRLDDKIGYVSVDDVAYHSQFFPDSPLNGTNGTYGYHNGTFRNGTALNGTYHNGTAHNGTHNGTHHDGSNPKPATKHHERMIRSRAHPNYYHVQKRGFWSSIGDAFKKVGETVKETAEKVVDKVTDTVKETAEKVVDKVKEVAKDLGTFTPVDKDISIKTDRGSTSTPWGNGFELYSEDNKGGSGSIAIYCVNCGATGNIHVKATITFSLTHGISEGQLSAVGPLSAALELGFVASYTKTWSYTKQIVEVPLSPFTLPGIVTLGPEITISAGGDLTVHAEGEMLAGLQLDWDKINATIDLADLSKSGATGLQPKLTPVFNVSGEIDIAADAFLEVSIGFGIDAFNGALKKQLAIVEKPDLHITANTTGQAGLGADGKMSGSIGSSTCKGVDVGVGFINYVYADLAGFAQKEINTWNGPSTSKCIEINQGSSSSKKNGTDKRDFPQLQLPGYARGIAPSASLKKNATAAIDAHQNGTTVFATKNGQFELHYADNGNIYAVPSNDSDRTVYFSSAEEGYVLGSADGRVLHGYVDTLEKKGVSRFRLAEPERMVKTGVVLTLAQVEYNPSNTSYSPSQSNHNSTESDKKKTTRDTSTSETITMAFDTAGDFYYPILCTYKDLWPKLFIATDPVEGVRTLEDPRNVDTITGANVTDCGFWHFRPRTE